MKLKPIAPRPVIDQGCHQVMPYPSMSADGRAGSVNRNAFVGANLGVHASPLEAITSMDPKDYVWGGGYDTSCYGSQPSAFTAPQQCYYPQASNHQRNFGQYGKPGWLLYLSKHSAQKGLQSDGWRTFDIDDSDMTLPSKEAKLQLCLMCRLCSAVCTSHRHINWRPGICVFCEYLGLLRQGSRQQQRKTEWAC